MKLVSKLLALSLIGAFFLAGAASAANTFPTSLNNWSSGQTISSAWANALEAKIGADSSSVSSSLDYITKNTSSTLGKIRSLATTTGNIIAGNGTNWCVVGVGTNGQVLTASSTATCGVSWAAVSSSSIVLAGLTGSTFLVNASGTLTITTSTSPNTLLLTGTGISLSSLSATSPISYNASTGVISCPTCNTASLPISILNGGTATTTTPGSDTYLVGNGISYELRKLQAGTNITISTTTTSTIISSSATGGSSSSTIDLIAGETINIGNAIRVSDGGNSTSTPVSNLSGSGTFYALPTLTTTGDQASSSIAQSFSTPSDCANLSTVVVRVKKQGTPSGDLLLQLRPDNGGTPSSTILASSSIASSSITTSIQNLTSATFTGSVALNQSTTYWLVATSTSALSNANDFLIDSAASPYGTVKLFDGSSYTNPTHTNGWAFQVNTATSTETAGQAYLASASLSCNSKGFIGFASTAASSTQSVTVKVDGVATGLTGLSTGVPYYLSNTTGTIATTAGTVTHKVGVAVSTTQMLITNIW